MKNSNEPNLNTVRVFPFCSGRQAPLGVSVTNLRAATFLLPSGHKVLIDAEDYARISHYPWRIQKRGYVHVDIWKKGKRRSIYLHRFILGTPKGLLTDHVNGNLLDNRKCNLRPATFAQNQWNRKQNKNTSRPYKGVGPTQNRNRWTATIDGKYIGTFKTAELAARAYDTAAVNLFGEFARLNFPLGNDISPVLQTCKDFMTAPLNHCYGNVTS